MNIIKTILAFILLTAPAFCFSQNNCDAILKYGFRDLKKEYDQNTTKYTMASENFSKLSYDINNSLLGSLEIEAFGYGKGGGQFSKQKRVSDLKIYYEKILKSKFNTSERRRESSLIVREAYATYEKCLTLNTQGLIIDTNIAPDNKSITISLASRGGNEGLYFYKPKIEGFSCSLTPKPNIETKNILLTDKAITLHCKRTKPKEMIEQGILFERYERGEINLITAKGNIQFYFRPLMSPKYKLESKKGVGEIVASMLYEHDFYKAYNIGTEKWVLADGRALPANCFYKQLTNENFAPNMQNRFLRGLSKTGSRKPGSFQTESTKMPKKNFKIETSGNHSHNYMTTATGSTYDNSNNQPSSPGRFGLIGKKKTNSIEGAHEHELTGGDLETRPDNIGIFYYIRIN